MNIKDLLQNLDKNLISEEIANEIVGAFESAVKEKTDSIVTLQVEKALMEQDEDHANKLKHILEKADDDHCEKLKVVVKAITENHTKKLGQIVGKYQKTIDEKASKFTSKVIADLDKFLSVNLEKKIPYSQIKEAVENTRARKQLDAIRNLISFDPEMVQESVKTVVKKGKSKIDQLSKLLSEENKKNLKLASELNHIKAVVLLEQKTKGMPTAKKEFVVKLLEDKDLNYIKENFNYVVEMFESGEEDETEKSAKEAVKSAVSLKANPSQVIAESNSSREVTKPKGIVNEYLSELERITK